MNKVQEICTYNFQGAPEALQIALQAEFNKELALLGDKVIAIYIAERGFDEGWSKSMINDRISFAASNERLSELCTTTGLVECIRSHPGQFGPLGRRTKADAVEAIIGAAYKSGGMPAAVTVMRALEVIDQNVI